jgi:peroxiredoxin
MKANFLLFTFIYILFFTACTNKKSYTIEGYLDGLINPTLYFVTSTKVDTVLSKNGKFSFTSDSDSLQPIIIYMEDGSVWMTVWAKNEDVIKISGEVNYPELIEVKGNEVNDLLTTFRQNNRKIIQEKSDLNDKLQLKSNETNAFDEDYMRLLTLDQLLIEQVVNFIKEHPYSIASLVLMQDYLIEQEDPALWNEYLSLIESPAREDTLYAKLTAIYQRLQQTSVGGSIAPDFSLIDTIGDTLTLKIFSDRYLLLSFVSSGCEACNEDYPSLERIRKKYENKNLDILTIVFDEDPNKWNKIKKEYNLNGFQAIDTQGLASPLLTLYNVNTLPNYFLIDPEGKIVMAHAQIMDIETKLKEKMK